MRTKNLLSALALILIALACAGATAHAAPQAAIYYVSTAGSDTNPGTKAAPWGTVQHAADTIAPGDTVYLRGGVYNERVKMRASGTDGAFITFAAYPSETPVLDGTGLKVKGNNAALILLADRSYIKIIGLELRNFKTAKRNRVPVGILVNGAGQHIELRNNRVHDIETQVQTLEGGDAHGIAFYGTRAPDSLRDIVIDGNELYNLKLGSSESMVVNGNVERFAITHNRVHDNNNIGIDAIGFEGASPDVAYDRARDGVISDNVVYNIDSFTNPAYAGERSADCLYVDGGTRIVMERNIAQHCNIGIELASELAGGVTSYVTLRNNFVTQNSEPGISIGGYDKQRGSTQNCLILNNTLYNNDTRAQGNGELYVQYDTRNNIIRNNIFYAGAQGLFIGSWSKVMTANVVDNNLYYTQSSGEWQWQNKSYSSFANYQSATGNDAHSTASIDPRLVNIAAPNLHLQTNSPAINAGVTLSDSGITDIDGQPRVQGASIDLGADEVK